MSLQEFRPLAYAALIAGRHIGPLWIPFSSNGSRNSTRIPKFACRVYYEGTYPFLMILIDADDSKIEDSSSSHSTPLDDGL